MTMAESPAEVLRAWMISQGLGSTVGQSQTWPVYAFNRPDSPDEVIVIYNTSAMLDGRYMRSGEVVEHPGIQVYLRGVTDASAWSKGIAIQDALEQLKNAAVTIGQNQYKLSAFSRTSSLTFIGQEEKNKRRQYTINGTVTVERVG